MSILDVIQCFVQLLTVALEALWQKLIQDFCNFEGLLCSSVQCVSASQVERLGLGICCDIRVSVCICVGCLFILPRIDTEIPS